MGIVLKKGKTVKEQERMFMHEQWRDVFLRILNEKYRSEPIDGWISSYSWIDGNQKELKRATDSDQLAVEFSVSLNPTNLHSKLCWRFHLFIVLVNVCWVLHGHDIASGDTAQGEWRVARARSSKEMEILSWTKSLMPTRKLSTIDRSPCDKQTALTITLLQRISTNCWFRFWSALELSLTS